MEKSVQFLTRRRCASCKVHVRNQSSDSSNAYSKADTTCQLPDSQYPCPALHHHHGLRWWCEPDIQTAPVYVLGCTRSSRVVRKKGRRSGMESRHGGQGGQLKTGEQQQARASGKLCKLKPCSRRHESGPHDLSSAQVVLLFFLLFLAACYCRCMRFGEQNNDRTTCRRRL